MSILDQLFPSLQEDPTKNPVQVRQVRPEDWVVSTTALAAHQAMNDAFRPGATRVDTTLGRPKFQTEGTIDVARSLAVSVNYRRLLVQEALKDIRFKPTADDVVDGGIKRGSKVIIKVVPEETVKIDSWDSIVRANIEDTDGTPRDLTFDKFSVMSITEPDEQRYQIHETFGADIIQTFGRRPRIVTLSGQVVNGKLDVSIGGEIRSMDWKNAFQRFYENHYSAHACTRKRKKIRIFAQDTIYDGYMLNLVAATTAMDQGLSQVTITFLLSTRNFPRENDDKIPGFGRLNDFQLTGKTVPDEYFPQPSIEQYFQNDFYRVLEVAIKEANLEKSNLVLRIARLAANDQTSTGNVELILSNISFWRASTRLTEAPESAFNYEYPIPYMRVHQLLLNTDIYLSILSLGQAESELKSKVGAFNVSVNSSFDASEIANVNSEDSAVNAEYKQLKNDESYLRFLRKGLEERLVTLNSLCDQIVSIERRLDQYNEIKSQLDEKRDAEALEESGFGGDF